MIKVTINKNTITISGHSGYDVIGKDIVCASVSSIVITTVNNILDIKKDAIEFNDDGNIMVIKKVLEDDIVNKLINNMILLLENLEKYYPKNIKISKGE